MGCKSYCRVIGAVFTVAQLHLSCLKGILIMKKYLLALLFMLLSGPAWPAPQGLKFIGDGTSNSKWDMVELPQSAANLLKGQTTFTVEFSIYLETYDNSKPVILFCMENGGAVCNDAWYLHEDKLKVDLEVSPGFHPSSSNPLSLLTSTWYHLTYVFNNGTWSFFLDGVAVGTAVDTSYGGVQYTTTPTSQRDNIYLGNYDASQLGGAFAADFRMDEFRIWSDVRSTAELVANKDSEIASDADGLVGYWKFNEIDASDGAAVVDSQTNITQSNGRMGISIAGGLNPTSVVGIVTAAVSNTAPIITLPSSPTVNEDDTDIALANDINITDADTDNQTVTLTITGGTSSIVTSGLTFTTGDGSDDSLMVFSGTLTNINTGLDAMTFTPTADLNGTNAGSIQIATNDGNGGSDDDTLLFDIISVNDAPVNTLPSSPTVNEDDLNVAISDAINIADIESDNQTVTLTITGGTVSIGTSGLSFTTGDGADDSSMVFSGTLANINTALDAMTFTPTLNLNGNNAGSVQIATNDGNSGADNDTLQFDITSVNDAPTVINPIADQSAKVGNEFTFIPPENVFSDADGDDLAISITGLPAWLTLTQAGYVGTPSTDDVGPSTITITANDNNGGTVSDVLILTVAPNNAPVITGTANTTVAEDSAYSFTPTVTDADSGDTKTFSINNKPTWAAFDTATGLLSGTPTNSHVGTISNIIITVADKVGAQASLAAFSLTVTNVNDAPTVINPIADQSAKVGNEFTFIPPENVFSDADGDDLAISITGLPAWLT
ncbi:MAG: hypothetical protein ACI935_001359, partial [Moritella dasanensis]